MLINSANPHEGGTCKMALALIVPALNAESHYLLSDYQHDFSLINDSIDGLGTTTELLGTAVDGVETRVGHIENNLPEGFAKGGADNSAIFGEYDSNSAEGMYCMVFGRLNTASGNSSVAEGDNNTVSGDSSHVEGSHNTAIGSWAHAEGTGTRAQASSAHAEGSSTTASAFNAHAEGSTTTASGVNSHAEGEGTFACAAPSHSEGYYNYAMGIGSHTEGSYTRANGYCLTAVDIASFVSNSDTITFVGGVIPSSYFAVGDTVEIKYRAGIAEKRVTSVVRLVGENSVSFNAIVQSGAQSLYLAYIINITTATGANGHAEGKESVASGINSHASGFNSIAKGYNQTVIGKYNVAQGTSGSSVTTDLAFIIGNGGNDATRSNALTVSWAGDIVNASKKINGVVMGGGTPVVGNTGFLDVVMDSTIKVIPVSSLCLMQASDGVLGQHCTLIFNTIDTNWTRIGFPTGFKTLDSVSMLDIGSAAGLTASISFVFDGTNWVETSRSNTVS